MKNYILIISLFVMLISCQKQIDKSPLALQTDFGRNQSDCKGRIRKTGFGGGLLSK